MSYLPGSCAGNYNEPLVPVQCTSCSNGTCDSNCIQQKNIVTQRLIWNGSRISSSEYTTILAAQTARGGANNSVLWNQQSDRAMPGQPTAYVPRTRTRGRPGSLGPVAKGVDVKHGSYARYLNRKKGIVLRTPVSDPLPTPKWGNKQYAVGIISNCTC